MKTPFRVQASEFDCVPTTFFNAVVKLFHRNEIPPLVIQRIYLLSLDSASSNKKYGNGTTGFAIQLLGHWLSEFETKNFSVSTEYISGEKVNFGRGSKISRCLNKDGVALLRVHLGGGNWHYILALSVENGVVSCFDPYPKLNRNFVKNKVEFIEENGLHSPNLLVSTAHLSTKSDLTKYVLGTFSERECLLLEKR